MVFFFQESSLLIYKSWVFTISFYISQNIHFAVVLMKYKIFLVKNYKFFVFKFFQRSFLFLNKSWFFSNSFYICQNIHFINIYIKKKSFKLKIGNKIGKRNFVCRLCLLINFIFLFNSENVSFDHCKLLIIKNLWFSIFCIF